MTMAMSYDELFEIFSWLPAKAIFKFSTVNKLFSKLPKETYFALKQSQNALLRDDTSFFIQPMYFNQIELHPLFGEKLSSGVSNEVLRFFSNSVKVLCSSNGLILCHAMNEAQLKLFISNPAMQSLLPIPIPEHLHNRTVSGLNIGFKCDSESFMVFIFYSTNSEDDSFLYQNCDIYLSKKGMWKSRERFFIGGRNLRFNMPVHYNGAIHFISDCSPYFNKNSPYFRPYIMSYNFEDGKSRMLRVPKDARKGSHDLSCDMRIFKWGKGASVSESICLVRLKKRVFTVWVLRNYESCLWRRVLKMRVKAIALKESDPIVKGYAVLNGDLLVFATEKKVYGIGLTDMRIQEICEHGFGEFGPLCFTSYSNTLRKCGGAGTLPLLHTCDSVSDFCCFT